MNLKLIALLVLLAGIHLTDSRCAFGCDCLGPSFKAARRDSEAVFSGTVTNIEIATPGVKFYEAVSRVTFKVSRIWKGSKDAERVITTRFQTTCSYFDFSMNSEYLVYAKGDGNTLSVNGCSRTTLLSNAGEDLKELGKGEPPSVPKSKKD